MSVENSTSLPSNENLETPYALSTRCFSQKPNGSLTISTMPPTNGTTLLGDARPRQTARNQSCAARVGSLAVSARSPVQAGPDRAAAACAFQVAGAPRGLWLACSKTT